MKYLSLFENFKSEGEAKEAECPECGDTFELPRDKNQEHKLNGETVCPGCYHRNKPETQAQDED